MPTLKKTLTAERTDLLKEHNDLVAEGKAILAKTEKNEELTAEEMTRDDEIAARTKEINERIEVIDKQLAVIKRQEAVSPKEIGELTSLGEGAPPKIEVKENFEKDPKAGFPNIREMMYALVAEGDDRQRNPIKDKRLRMLATAGTDEQGTHSAPHGGFWVPEGLLPGYLSLQPEDDPLAGMTRPVPMNTPIVRIRARTDKDHSSSIVGGLQVVRKEETVAATATRMEVERINLEAHTLFGLNFESEELVSRSPDTWAALIADGFQDAFADKLLDERINGNGGDEFVGVMTSPCLVTVSAETGQDATTIVYENLVNMKSRCWKFNRSIWLYNHDCEPQLMTMTSPDGQLVWQQSARDDKPNMIFGRPAYATEYTQTLGTKGDILLGVWMEYLEGVYTSMQRAESIHVRFVEHEHAIKFWTENAGAPWWRSALTPKNSTNTLSPFVTLAART